MRKFLICLFSIFLLIFSGCKKSLQNENVDNEFMQGGLVFDEDEYNKLPRKATLITRDYSNLPSSYSLQKYTPKPKSQGSYGTCVAWASTYAGITTCNSISNNLSGNADFISDNSFSPYYLYRKIKPKEIKPKETNGMSLEEALLFLQNNGVPKRNKKEDKIDFKDFDISMYDNASLYRIDDYVTLFSSYDVKEKKISAVKKSISEKKPVLISFKVINSFLDSYNTKYWKKSDRENLSGYHAMLLIGYDDDFYIPGSVESGAVLLQNSWGTKWGNDGYIWVRYSDFAEYCRGAFEMSTAISSSYFVPEIIKPEPKPEPNPEPKPIPSVEKKCIFDGEISLSLFSEDSQMSLKYSNSCYNTVEQYESGTRFQVFMTNRKPCYVYAFASDSVTSSVNPIFPLENVSALLDYSENTIVYPSEDTCIELDNITGEDYLIVLYSLQKLDLEQIMKKYKSLIKKNINIYDAVKESVGSEKVLSRSDIEFNIKKISFKASVEKPNREMILPIVIKIRHIAQK